MKTFDQVMEAGVQVPWREKLWIEPKEILEIVEAKFTRVFLSMVMTKR